MPSISVILTKSANDLVPIFFHDVTEVNLHGNLLVHESGGDQGQNVPFAGVRVSKSACAFETIF
jgi:hypothetical protein